MPQATAETRLLFLNTHLFGGTIPATVSRKLAYRDELRSDEIARRLTTCGADIIVLAETWAESTRERIARKSASAYPHSWWPKMRPSLLLAPGIMLLSKAPIAPLSFDQFCHLHDWDRLARKGVACAQTAEIVVVFTHTQAGTGQLEAACRAKNIDQICAAISRESTATRTRRMIVVGDFNVIEARDGDTTVEFKRLCERVAAATDLGLNDAFRALYPDRLANPGFSSGDLEHNTLSRRWPKDSYPGRLDHVFVPASARVISAEVPRDWKVEDPKVPASDPMHLLDVSDHWPLAVSIAWDGQGAVAAQQHQQQ